MLLGCFPRTLFLLLQQLIMFLRWHHNGRRKFMLPLNMLPWACFPIPPIVRHLTLPPASWYTPWCGDFHQGLSWNLYNLVRVFDCVCVCVCSNNLFFSRKPKLPQFLQPYIWSRAQIEPFVCLMLKLDSSWNIEDEWKWRHRSLPPIFFATLQWPRLLCVTNRSSQKIKPVAVAKECASEAYKWRHTLQVQKQRACVKTSEAKIWHLHSRAYWCSGYNVPHFTVSISASTPVT